MECIKASTLSHLRSVKWDCSSSYSTSAGRLSVKPGSLALIHNHAPWDFLSQYCKSSSIVYPRDNLLWRHSAHAAAIGLDEQPSLLSEGDHLSDDAGEDGESEELASKQFESSELKSLLVDSERAKLIRKLSDANQYYRILKRQLQTRDDALANFQTELAVLELELQALVGLAKEVASSSVQIGSRKINGKYIQSHLLSRLEAVHGKVKEQIKDVNPLKFEEVTVFWIGMAESVQVMGSFDGWSQGEEMSPEYSGDYARFTATFKLRPGRYEIKFVVDGEWQLSPEFPTVGEGAMENNLLIVG